MSFCFSVISLAIAMTGGAGCSLRSMVDCLVLGICVLCCARMTG
jgi:hypothetical protein